MFKLLNSLMVLLTVVSLNAYSGGAGLESDPYQIANVSDLKELMSTKNDWNKYFIQIEDIDIESQTAGITPIGTVPNNGGTAFSGSYMGNHKKISNLKIDMVNGDKVGLFGYIDGGKISNLTLENVNIIGRDAVGSLAGWLQDGEVLNCSASGIVTGAVYVSGFIGDCENGLVENCSTSASVYGSLGIGGFVGWLQDCEISKSCATGNVTLENEHNTVGGFVGFSGGPEALVTNSYATGNVIGYNFVGGFAGNIESGTFENNYSVGNVNGVGAVGGFVGITTYGNFTSCYWDVETSGQTESGAGEGKTTAEMKEEATYVGWDFENIWYFDENINNGYPSLVPEDVVDITEETTLPSTSVLMENYPNPFNPTTTINYLIPESGNISLSIYNSKGQLVEKLVNEFQKEGLHKVEFDASHLNSGAYYYTLKTSKGIVTNKMLLIK
ncbi:MAG: hypothetical protein CR982_07890 [Candidatus Cloacimonadota bacterium]|nr:MAG: hypothetical protein CR982_07890 [Candidatus Cloacimonadota bacterium]PIE78224.1 MAG: hypothetical protein CSA15_08650 [Candidatus Delongbacteria bacterium]